MRGFIGFTKRNLSLYFKDKQAIIFSMLTSIIVFVLYLLFLKGNYVDAINSGLAGLEDIISSTDVEMLVNGILLVGIMGSALITIPYNCLSTIISDRERKIDYDICATPLKRWQIVLAYFVASTISAFVMVAIIFTVGILVISGMGNLQMGAERMLLSYLLILLGAISSTAFFMIIVLFFKTSSASGAFFGMLSAASGFVIGAYIPVAQFSNGVQTFCNLFPASHVTIMFRNLLLNGILDKINTSINGLDGGMFVETTKYLFTFNARLFDNSMSSNNSVLYVALFAVACAALMIVLYSKTYKRK